MSEQPGMTKKLIRFFILILVAVVISHYTVPALTTLFFIAVLVVYYRSEGNEPFWFAFFFIMQDGIVGYFTNFEQLVKILPGLPAVEAGQLYIAIALVKALRVKEGGFQPFFSKGLVILLIYMIFLVIQGYAWGVSLELNIQFRIVKFVLPMFLLYALPKLMTDEKQYWEILHYLFPITFTVLFAQVFTIQNGRSPALAWGVQAEASHLFIVTKDIAYRGFFNDGLVLITTLGSFLALGSKEKRFSNTYMYIVIISLFLSIFLSATRGWILGFLLVSVCFLFFVSKIRPAQTLKIAAMSVILLTLLYSIPVVTIQVDNAWNRFMTLQALAGGDITAGGTLVRLEKRSPLVLKRWAESPLTGIGFSNDFFRHGDMHVANQNILLHTGIIGAIALFSFIIFFMVKMFSAYASLPKDHPNRNQLLIFQIFFLGWFLIHSVTSQQFAFYAQPHQGMVIGYYFSFAALIYLRSQESRVKASSNMSNERLKNYRNIIPQ
jgi:hypothetical protein